MSGFSSSTGFEQLPPLISCPECGGRVFTWIARAGQNAGVRFYKCVNKDAGICNYMRTKAEYLAELSYHMATTQQPLQGSSQSGACLNRRARVVEQQRSGPVGPQASRAQPLLNQAGSSAPLFVFLCF
ncbi:uncharacterized protein [Triticum aestivum]|uniref:uncharacterized protein n=1 Tax=Triticum aestivum TaxID=4565 RepID=UPI001D0338FD|nr:uncharacterized protein LOC123157460 [Triticum aestivum]